MTWRQTFAAALVMALVAAALVWWLERSRVERMMSELHGYLRNQDEFRKQYPETDA